MKLIRIRFENNLSRCRIGGTSPILQCFSQCGAYKISEKIKFSVIFSEKKMMRRCMSHDMAFSEIVNY